MSEHLTCRHPDRDCPKLICGYPLPCPYHTVTLDLGADPPTVTIPVTSDAMKSPMRERVGQIGRALASMPKAKPKPKGRKR
jgi:hypothetical protein